MFMNSLNLFHKILICGLVVVLCLIFLDSIYNRQDGIRSKKRLVATANEIAKPRNRNSGAFLSTDDGNNEIAEAAAVILWWTPFIDEMEYTKNCGNSVCFFTGKHKYINHEKLKTLLFYGSNLNATDLPLPRSPDHLWALFHEESPKNVPFLLFEPAMSLFNVTATYSQNSDLPLTLQSLESYNAIIDKKLFVDVQEKNRLQMEEDLAPVLYVQSICDTMSGRDDYVAELMKYIKVDSYGKCLNNKVMPTGLAGDDYLNTIDTEEFRKFIARYKFVIAYENSVCNDYLTEKIWRPLTLGVVPVYFGAPNIERWLPNKNSAILIGRFPGPKQLADHLKYVNNNDKDYNQYLEHKIDQKVENQVLSDELRKRIYETNSLIEDFECFVCQQTVELPPGDRFQSKILVGRPFEECGEELVYPKMSKTPALDQDWRHTLSQGKCEASIIQDYVRDNTKIDKEQYHKELINRYEKGVCGH